VHGAGGMKMHDARTLKNIAELCAQHDGLLIADEIMTGFGRTGRNFAVDHWNVEPDIIVAGKGIASGYMPLGAVIVTRKIVDAIARGSGSLVHGFTYNAHPVAVAAGRAVLKKIVTENLVQIARDTGEPQQLGTPMRIALQTLRQCRSVGDIRGLGLLWAVEFAEAATTKPYDPSLQYAATVAKVAAERGVLTYPMQGCVDGILGDHLLLAPPAVTSATDLEWAVEQLKLSIREVEPGPH
jgi:adenosylmethionine-8-amino-7-oxononanoate aminotransferase